MSGTNIDIFSLKHLITGKPLKTTQALEERLSKKKALAVFSSDALSSVAYATEEAMLILVLAGGMATMLAWPISIAIAILLAIVVTSYYQTIHAYPSGGGAYVVAHDNLGEMAGLIAAAALLTDYVLTVAVSVTAGVAAITSAAHFLYPYRVVIGIIFVIVITIANLRGIRESGTIFAIPSYMFIFTFLLMVGKGMFDWVVAGMPPAVPVTHAPAAVQGLTLFLVLRAFSSGCTALTGIEAISNGVPSFKPPEADNAGKTLATMAVLSITMFVGVTFLAHQFGIIPHEATHETLVSQLGRRIFGSNTPLYFLLQTVTMAILTLAANTSFAGFPRLVYILAKDRYMPRQLTNLGDKLVYSNGILMLGVASSLLIVIFNGETTRLIPLYAVGVFLSFTLSQTGMVVRWFRLHTPLWWLKGIINGVGALATGIVLLIIASTKFIYGAWMVIMFIPFIVVTFRVINNHFKLVAQQLSLERTGPPPRIRRHRVIIPISGVHQGVIQALEYARSISNDVTAVFVEVNPEETETIRRKWQKWGDGVRLEVIPSPYRSIMGPLMEYVNKIDDVARHDDVVTIVLPQFVPAKWWHNLLHNQSAILIRFAFLLRSNTIVVDVPYHLQK